MKKKIKNTKKRELTAAAEVEAPVLAQHFARRLKVQDNINTDYVISGRYKFRIQDPKELCTCGR
jgi:hypothetical protein